MHCHSMAGLPGYAVVTRPKTIRNSWKLLNKTIRRDESD